MRKWAQRGAVGGETPWRSWRTHGTVGERTVGTSTVRGVSWKEGVAGWRARLLTLRLGKE